MGTYNTTSSYGAPAPGSELVVDLDLRDLPESANTESLKKTSGVKHIISASVDEDSIKNVCLGTGRIKLRLQNQEELDQVKMRFLQEGFSVIDHAENSKKKTGFTTEQSNRTKSPVKKEVNAKQSKIAQLSSNNPEMFGNNTQHANKFNGNDDYTEMNQNKADTLKESQAISNWTRVGGKR